jgi:hypothetical protein
MRRALRRVGARAARNGGGGARVARGAPRRRRRGVPHAALRRSGAAF